MKKYIFATLGALLAMGCNNHTPQQNETIADTVPCEIKHEPTYNDSLLALATAFAIQESELKEDSVSPCGNYVGCLQISVIMVAEANRLLGYVQYVTTADRDDRLDKYNSLEIFRIVQSHHNPDLDVDKAIDIWNKNAPRQYRENVKYYYEQLLNDRELYIFF